MPSSNQRSNKQGMFHSLNAPTPSPYDATFLSRLTDEKAAELPRKIRRARASLLRKLGKENGNG